MKILVALIMFSLLAFSCKEKPAVDNTSELELSADLKNYEDEVMKIHDEVMPKMNEIHQLSTELRNIRSDAGANPDGTPVKMEGLDESLQALKDAEDGMMNWMKNYTSIKTSVKPEQLKRFYEKELEKITHVKDSMLNSIEQAKAWLAAHPAG